VFLSNDRKVGLIEELVYGLQYGPTEHRNASGVDSPVAVLVGLGRDPYGALGTMETDDGCR
jgi:hypothetical protein